MATRSRKVGAPTVRTASDVPVTRAMLGSLRTEVLQRIDQAREEAKADNERLDAKIDAVNAELKAEIQGVRAELHEVRAELHEVKAVVHGMQAQMARIELLVEEQNNRNKIVLDGITALLDRQNQVEQRMSQVEGVVRMIAASQAAAKRD